MPDQNQPPSPQNPMTPAMPPAPPAVPPSIPEQPRPNFVAFEETAQPSPLSQTPPPPPPIGGPSPSISPSNVVTSSGGGSKKKIILVVLGVILLLALGAGVFIFTQQSAEPEVVETPEPIAVVSAYCGTIKAYDATGNLLSSTQLAELKLGSIIRFAASGITNSGTIDAARFTVNGIQRPEVVTKVAGTDEFYDEYIIPEGVTSFDVTAQVHIADNDTWY